MNKNMISPQRHKGHKGDKKRLRGNGEKRIKKDSGHKFTQNTDDCKAVTRALAKGLN